MLLKDEATQAHIAKGDFIEHQNIQGRGRVEDRRHDYRIVERSGKDITDIQLQMGSSMFTNDFAKKLKAILPAVIWEIHPTRKTKSLFYLHGKLLVAGEYPWMPEWSVCKESYERLPAHSPDKITTKEGYDVEYFHPGVPTMQTVAVGYFEDIRGWRTVLLKIFLQGYLNLTQMENVFGRGHRASWARTLEFYGVGPNDLIF